MVDFFRLYSNRVSLFVLLIGAICSFFSRSYLFEVGLSPFRAGIVVGSICAALILLLRLFLQVFARKAFFEVRNTRFDLMAAADFAKVDAKVKLALALQAVGLLTAFFAFGWLCLTMLLAF